MKKKGISPLIAAIILVVIAVTLASIFSGWYSTLISLSTDTIGNKSTQTINCNAAKLTIEDVYLDLPDRRARVNVRNSGQTREEIASAKVYSINGTEAPATDTYPINISKGNFRSLTFNTEGAITACSNFSYAIVSSQCSSIKFEGQPKNC